MSQVAGQKFEAPTESAAPERKLRVFISYSRTDLQFADRLVAALEARGLLVLIDKRDLPLLEEWQRELLGFIRQADSVVYVLSPASIVSEWCEWEVAQVAALHKRLAPIVAKPLPADAKVPAAIGKINFLFFTDDTRFEDAADQLVKALNTDITWIKEHTRLGERGRLWLVCGKPDASLLRGGELQDAERWLITQPREAPPPTDLDRQFIQESRSAEQARIRSEQEQLERTRRFQKRAGRALSAFAVLLIAAALATAWQVRETNRRQAALYAGKAAQWSDKGHCDQAMRYALLALPAPGALPFFAVWSVEAEAQLLRAAWPCRLVSRIAFAQGVSSVALAPDAKRLLVTGKDGSAMLVDADTGGEIARLEGHKDSIKWGAFSPDGGRAATAGWDRLAIVWDLTTLRRSATLTGHTAVILSVMFSPDGQSIVTASDDRTARLWDATSGKELGELIGHKDGVNSASFSPDGKLLVTSGKDGVAIIWDAVTRQPLHVLSGHSGWVTWAAFSPDGSRVVTTSVDKTAQVWDTQTGKRLFALVGHTDDLHAAAFSPDGRLIATGSDDTTIRLWDAATGQPLDRIDGHSGAIWSVVFSADSTRVISASDDRTVRVSSAANIKKGRRVFEADSVPRGAQFSNDGGSVVAWMQNGMVGAWDIGTGRPLRTSQRAMNVRSMAPGGALVATVTDGSAVTITDWAKGHNVITLPSAKSGVSAAVFDGDGARLAVIRADGTAQVWDAKTGAPLSAPLRQDSMAGAAFSPDGRHLLTFGPGKQATIWDIARGTVEATTGASHDERIFVGEYSRDGRLVVTGSKDDSAWIMDGADYHGLFRLWHKYWVISADFSPDGGVLATTTGDRTYIWHTGSGVQLAELDSPSKYQTGAKFSPDGRTLLSWGGQSADAFDVALLTSRKGTALRDLVCGTLIAKASVFTTEEMADAMLAGNSEARAPCSRVGMLSGAYWTALAHDALAWVASAVAPGRASR